MSAYDDLGRTDFEIEHLVPVGKLKNIANKYSGLPIGTVANLCLLTKELNQTKSDLTIYEYFDQEVSDETMNNDQAAEVIAEIEEYTFTDRDDLKFVLSDRKFTKDAYLNFLNQRFAVLKEKFFSLNKIRKQ